VVEFVSDLEFEFAREVFVNPEALSPGHKLESQDADRKRLNNMGYSAGQDLAENVANFQRDVRQAITGLLEDVRVNVRDHHDERSQPPQGVGSRQAPENVA
jgi:hypothetical protein